MPPPPPPLSRRQSYDQQPLTLGTLPTPNFRENLPTGLRSVPATATLPYTKSPLIPDSVRAKAAAKTPMTAAAPENWNVWASPSAEPSLAANPESKTPLGLRTAGWPSDSAYQGSPERPNRMTSDVASPQGPVHRSTSMLDLYGQTVSEEGQSGSANDGSMENIGKSVASRSMRKERSRDNANSSFISDQSSRYGLNSSFSSNTQSSFTDPSFFSTPSMLAASGMVQPYLTPEQSMASLEMMMSNASLGLQSPSFRTPPQQTQQYGRYMAPYATESPRMTSYPYYPPYVDYTPDSSGEYGRIYDSGYHSAFNPSPRGSFGNGSASSLPMQAQNLRRSPSSWIFPDPATAFGAQSLSPPPMFASPYPMYPSLDLQPRRSVAQGSIQPSYVGTGLLPANTYAQAGSRPVRSALLEEFRATRNGPRTWRAVDFIGHIAEFACDQLGSRYIQEHILADPSQEDVNLLFAEMAPLSLALATDVFANFCIQKLLEKGNPNQKRTIGSSFITHALRLSFNIFGCRCIQKVFDECSKDIQAALINELDEHVLRCARDQNANHVLQKAIEVMQPSEIGFIADAFVGNVYALAAHSFGCRVLQRIFERFPTEKTGILLDEVMKYIQALMQDQYGNYVIQWLLEHGTAEQRSEIIDHIRGQVLHLSKHKFASNVIEKCVMHASEEELSVLANEIMTPRLDGTAPPCAIMLKHEFANYALQRFVIHTKGAQHRQLVQTCASQLQLIRPHGHSKHIVAVEKLITAEMQTMEG